MINYTLGFCFRDGKVLLIKKNRGPEYVVGKMNGIGGKIEHQETLLDGMIREFHEETSVLIEDWHLYSTLNGTHADGTRFSIFCFFNYADGQPFQVTDDGTGETLHWVQVGNLDDYPVVPNLKWLIPLAVDSDGPFVINF